MHLTASVADIALNQASLYAILGYAVVFFGLILLMLVVILVGKAFTSGAKKEEIPVVVVPAPVEEIPAPGAAGQLKLHNVEPKTAAMLMAIVANKLGRPINELRFISIKEVTK